MQFVGLLGFDVVPIPFVLLCAFLGFAGQFIRGVIGIYKVHMEERGKCKKKHIDKTRFLLSLLLGAMIGAFLCLIFEVPLSKTDVVALISAGYSGTDFIESFFTRRSEQI